MPHSYLGLKALKSVQSIASTDTSDDSRLRAVLEAISVAIDDLCERTFRIYLATHYYTPAYADRLYLDHDLLAITTLKTDEGGDGTFEYTWDSSDDYHLKPFNAAARKRPYWEIAVPGSGGDYSFPCGVSRSVEVVGRWGYWQDLETLTPTVNEVLDTTETGVDVTDGTVFDVCQTILVDSEQLYITAISGNTLTVERGVNGTSAASHSSGASIQRYRYPGPIVEAARILAARIFKRPEAAFGLMGSAEMGTASVIARTDPDVRMLTDHYRWLAVA